MGRPRHAACRQLRETKSRASESGQRKETQEPSCDLIGTRHTSQVQTERLGLSSGLDCTCCFSYGVPQEWYERYKSKLPNEVHFCIHGHSYHEIFIVCATCLPDQLDEAMFTIGAPEHIEKDLAPMWTALFTRGLREWCLAKQRVGGLETHNSSSPLRGVTRRTLPTLPEILICVSGNKRLWDLVPTSSRSWLGSRRDDPCS
jgi:hypothetical protein